MFFQELYQEIIKTNLQNKLIRMTGIHLYYNVPHHHSIILPFMLNETLKKIIKKGGRG